MTIGPDPVEGCATFPYHANRGGNLHAGEVQLALYPLCSSVNPSPFPDRHRPHRWQIRAKGTKTCRTSRPRKEAWKVAKRFVSVCPYESCGALLPVKNVGTGVVEFAAKWFYHLDAIHGLAFEDSLIVIPLPIVDSSTRIITIGASEDSN